LRLKARIEPIDDLFLMFWTGKNSNCSVLYGDHGVIRTIWCEVATRAVDTTGWPMIYEFSRVFGREPGNRGELRKMFITANKREGELIQQKERHRVTARGVESGLTRITRDRRMTE